MSLRLPVFVMFFSVLAACGRPSPASSVHDAESQLFASTSNSGADAAANRYLARTTRLRCDGLEVFDFLLESANVIGEWCRAQNNQLKEKGCGVDTSLCVKELLMSELPGSNLTIGVSTTAGTISGNPNGTSVTQSEYRWSGGQSSSTSHGTWGGDASHNYVELTLSVGVEIPLGNRKLQRVTCVNPLDHEYVRMLAENVVLNNETLKKFAAVCRVQR